jgi:hypothetical protein
MHSSSRHRRRHRYVMQVERLARHKLSEAVHGGGRDE